MANMAGYCWPLSGAPGETIEFRTTTTSDHYSVTYVRFQNNDPDEVDDSVIRKCGEMVEIPIASTFEQDGQLQNANHTSAEGANDWEISFSLEVPEEWQSGIYRAKCVDDDGATFYVPFIIKPNAAQRNPLLVLANTNTWNAYNPEFGYSRYVGVTGSEVSFELSFLRPNQTIFNLAKQDDEPTAAGYPFGFTSKHQMRGELWILNWLAQSGYRADVYTDLDFHAGIEGMEDYDAIIISTHPEYWSQEMYQRLADYLDGGGCLLYLGGNGLFDSVTISDDLQVMTCYGGVLSRTRLFGQMGLPESKLLGVATPLKPGEQQIDGVDTLQADGNNFPERVSYRVKAPEPGHALHSFFLGLQPGDEFGKRGWFLATGQQELFSGTPASIDNSGASGGECDKPDASSPPEVEVLAIGQNSGPHAEMTYYDHPGGGFVFSVGSISFGGSLIIDKGLQRILCNALDECLG